MKNPVRSHPNTTVGAGAGGVGILVVWALGHLGVSLPAEVAGAITVAASSVALFIGRNGLRGIVRVVWRGKPS